MRIASLRLENFRTYKESTSLENVKGLNMFIDPNNSGKSNVLHAFRILHDLAKNRLDPDIFRKEINENDIDGETMIEVIIDLSDFERKILMNRFGGDYLVDELPRKNL